MTRVGADGDISLTYGASTVTLAFYRRTACVPEFSISPQLENQDVGLLMKEDQLQILRRVDGRGIGERDGGSDATDDAGDGGDAGDADGAPAGQEGDAASADAIILRPVVAIPFGLETIRRVDTVRSLAMTASACERPSQSLHDITGIPYCDGAGSTAVRSYPLEVAIRRTTDTEWTIEGEASDAVRFTLHVSLERISSAGVCR